MSLLDRPTFWGDDKSATQVCPARRPVHAPLMTGPETGSDATWHLDCVLRNQHTCLHEDIHGKRWETTTS